MSGTAACTASTMGATRESSTSEDTDVAPGRVLWPPICEVLAGFGRREGGGTYVDDVEVMLVELLGLGERRFDAGEGSRVAETVRGGVYYTHEQGVMPPPEQTARASRSDTDEVGLGAA